MDHLIDAQRNALISRKNQLQLELMCMDIMSSVNSYDAALTNANIRRRGKVTEELETNNKERLLLSPLCGSNDPFSFTQKCEKCSKDIPLIFGGHIFRCPACDAINYGA